MFPSVRFDALGAVALLIPLAFALSCSDGPHSVRSGLANPPESFDQPDAAFRYQQMKRFAHDGQRIGLDERYRRARDHMERMPRYSSKAGKRLPTRQEERQAGFRDVGMRRLIVESRWLPLGPGNIGGRTRALVVDPRRPQRLFAAGVSGGVWRSDDNGDSWQPRSDFLSNIGVNTLVMDPRDSEVLYAGTGEGYFREVVRGTALPLRGGGIFKTTDAGRSWQRLESTAGDDFLWVNDLAHNRRQPGVLYAATRSGVWRSTDSGQTWQRILETALLGGCFHLALDDSGESDRLLASCGTFQRATVHLSRNAASDDAAFQPVLSEEGMGLTSLAIAPSDPGIVYALSASYLPGPNNAFNGGLHAVFRSDQGGEPGSWTPLVRNTDPKRSNTLLLSNPIVSSRQICFDGVDGVSNLGWYTNVIAVDPVDPDIVWAGGVDLFRSDDGGRNWGPVSFWWSSPPSPHADQHVIVFDPGYDGQSNQRMYLGGDGGVWRSDNARAFRPIGERASCDPSNILVEWDRLNRQYGVTQFYHGAPFPGGESYLGGTQDNGTLIGDDQSGIDGWRRIMGGDGGYVAIDPDDPDIIYAESQFLGLGKSTNGGLSFASAVDGIGESRFNFLFITPFAMDPGDSQRLWTGGRRMWRTIDRAESWTGASGQLDPAGGQVSAIAVSPQDGNRVLAGLNNGRILRTQDGLSANPLTPWQAANPRAGFVTWLTFDPVDVNVAYAAYAGFGGGPHVWKSADGGATWSPLDGSGASSLPDIPVHNVLVDPEDRSRIYLGTDLGVFVSLDGGASWSIENTGFPNTVTESLALEKPPEGPPLLFAFTHGRGAWRAELQQGTRCNPQRWITHLTPPGVDFETEIVITNFSQQRVELILKPYLEDGSALFESPVTVEAGESRVFMPNQLFPDQAVSHFGICGSPSAAVTASYRLTTGPAISAQVNENVDIDQEYLFYPGEWDLVFDGIAVVNLGQDASRIEAVLLDDQGREMRRVVLREDLAPNAKHTTVVDFEFQGLRGGAVRIESSQRAMMLVLRGTRPGTEPMLLYPAPPIAAAPRR